MKKALLSIATASAIMTANSLAFAGWNTPTGTPANNVTIGFRSDMDSKLVCGKIEPSGFGNGYAFVRGQTGPNFNIGVTKYSVTSSGVTSSATGHVLQQPYLGYAVASFYNLGVPTAGTIYIFGGRGPITASNPTGYTNEFYKYDPSSGFSNGDGTAIGTAPSHMMASPRAGMSAVAIDSNHIFLFGGYDVGGARAESYIYEISSNSWAQKADVAIPIQNAKTLISGTPTNRWVYVIGGDQVVNSNSNVNRKIYRYNVSTNDWIVLKKTPTMDLELPIESDKGRHISIASVQGAMLILAETDAVSPGTMGDFRLTHPTSFSAGVGIGATLTARTYNVPARARDDFELLRCSPDTWVIGGTYGHGSTYQDRSTFVDKLTR